MICAVAFITIIVNNYHCHNIIHHDRHHMTVVIINITTIVTVVMAILVNW